jgi:DHA2 family multidrug resistance protein
MPPSASGDRDSDSISRWLIAIAVLASAIMELVDTSAVNVSLPYIAGNLSASVNESTWVLTSYLIANAVVLPTAGWLANYLGRRRLLLIAVSSFTLASVLCGLAPSLPWLIVFRILQGAGGGALQPASRAILLETFPPRDRGKAMAFWGVGIVVAPILAPVLGGWLTTDYSWRLIFFINVPVGVLALVLVSLFITDPPYIRRTSNRIDYWGLGMLAIGMAALQVMLDKGQEDDWFGSHFILTLAIVAAICLTAFVVWEVRSPDPIVRFRLFRHRTFAVGVALYAILAVVLFGSNVLMPLFMQELLGFPAVTAGWWVTPRGLVTMACMPIAGLLISRQWDMRRMLTFGIPMAALGTLALASLNLRAGPWNFVPPQIAIGMGFSFTFVPLATLTVDPISKEDMGYATSITGLVRNVGGAIGISTVTTLLARREQVYRSVLTAHVNVWNPTAAALTTAIQRRFERQGASFFTASHQSLLMINRLVNEQAKVLSYLDGFRLLGVLFLLVAPLIWLMRKPKMHHEAVG